MTIQLLPTYDTPTWSQTSTFEGATFHLAFQFNQREACWYLSVSDAGGVDIYNGVKLVCKQLLLARCVDPRRPAGDLYVVDSSGLLAPPGLEDLVQGAGRCRLYYVTSDLLALARAGNVAGLQAFDAALATNSATGNASTYGSQ